MNAKSILRLLLLPVFFYASLSCAEGPCPAGQRMVGQQNVPGASYPICQAIPGSNSEIGQPRPVWADRWGAVAADTTTGNIGTVVGRPSRSEAIDAAMRDCSASGAKHCTLKLAYSNQCAAGAWGAGAGGRLAWARHPELEGASKLAISKCIADGGEECKSFYSDCSYAERVR